MFTAGLGHLVECEHWLCPSVAYGLGEAASPLSPCSPVVVRISCSLTSGELGALGAALRDQHPPEMTLARAAPEGGPLPVTSQITQVNPGTLCWSG